MGEMAMAQQMLRDMQLKNTYTMEHIDELVDRILEVKKHIEYLKKDTLIQRNRQLNYLGVV